MKTDYFTGSENVKETYKRLVLQHHPDRGGDTEIMAEINRQYDEAIKNGVDVNVEGQNSADIDIILKEPLQTACTLDKVTVEICGAWIWVSGDTKPHKEVLKAAGYRWACKKKMWYFAGKKARNRREMSMDDIREYHGSKKVKKYTKKYKKIA